jgi:UDP:flavonoid glycosyltransferase YjiC (YdhE family)
VRAFVRIAIHTLGTRGDVQPYVALARGLAARGHAVQLAAPEQFAGFVHEHGIACAPLPGEFLALLDAPEGKAALAGGGSGFGPGFRLLKHVRPLMRRLMDLEWDAARAFRPDLVVHHPKSLAAPHIAEALGCRSMLASPLPGFTPTSAFASPLVPFASLGPLNRASHRLATEGARWLFGRQMRDWRVAVLGLPRRRAGADPALGTLYAYSRHVLSVPDDWGRDVLVSGYWFLDEAAWQPPPGLAAFLEAGLPPVYIGFGSMPGIEPRRLTEIVVAALARTGKRGLLATGGGALASGDLPPDVLAIGGAPHDRLLPRVAAVVHHGGAGTTGAALRAGRPSVICPFFGDQPFWARRVAALGAGPPALDRRTLTAEGLAAALVATDGPEMRRRAAGLGAAIRQEDGVGAAVTFIEERVASSAGFMLDF